MGHGFSGTKRLGLPVYATQFAEAGLAVLAFDYRHFGASGGEPRQVVDVAGQRNDFRAAVQFARSTAGIDPNRVAVWGTSLSGGHVLAVAATDPRLAAVVAQVPLIDARQTGRTLRERLERAATSSMVKLLLAAAVDAVAAGLRRPPHAVRVFGEPGSAALFTDEEALRAIEAMGAERSGWRNAFAPRFVFSLPRYRAGTAEKLGMPLLVCVAERDLEASPALAAEVARRAPRGHLKSYPAGHFGVYVGPVQPQMIEDQLAFLIHHLNAPPAGNQASAGAQR